jgi:two-component sensor histidine kinase
VKKDHFSNQWLLKAYCLTETLGLKLITTLVIQIDGTIDLDRIGGTMFTIAFRGVRI